MKRRLVYPLVAAGIALLFLPFGGRVRGEEPGADILFTTVVCKEPGRYIGWPTVVKTASGELLAVFSGDRDEHVCPWGKTEIVRSADGGRTWSSPVTVNNTPLDDRDAGILLTEKGTVIVSWFTSLAFDDSNYTKHYPAELVKSWRRHAEKLGPETRKQWLGSWVRRSTDGGRTWGDPVRVQGSAPHGPIQLRGSRLLYVGRVYFDSEPSLSVEESSDDGQTWRRIGTVPIPPGGDIKYYHEPHAVETDFLPGRIVVMIREEEHNIMMQSESTDGGRTWTTAHSTGIWGCPPHLLRLRDGRLVAVYGYRREPFGERACISINGGRTWDTPHPITIASAHDGDLGYPASVELADGSIFTVFYQKEKPGEKTCLMGTRWRLK
jgi:hypothetical protein